MNRINKNNSNRCLTSFALQTSFDMTTILFEKKSEDVGDLVANVFAFPPLFKKRPSFRTERQRSEESVENNNCRLTLDCFLLRKLAVAMTAVAYLRHAVVAGNGFSTNITSLRDERDGLRLLKKQIRPERAQSIAYGNAIRENIRQTLSPERAQSIRCQAFSLRHAMITIFVWRCHTLLIQGLRPKNIFVHSWQKK